MVDSAALIRHFEVARETGSRWLSKCIVGLFWGANLPPCWKCVPQKVPQCTLKPSWPGLPRNLEVANAGWQKRKTMLRSQLPAQRSLWLLTKSSIAFKSLQEKQREGQKRSRLCTKQDNSLATQLSREQTFPLEAITSWALLFLSLWRLYLEPVRHLYHQLGCCLWWQTLAGCIGKEL